jgi:uncharacterized protein (TIGR03435 family)
VHQRLAFVLLSTIAVGTPFLIHGQVPQPSDQKPPTFEVASIKSNTSGQVQMTIVPSPSGLVVATNVSPYVLIRYAYDLPEARITGLPRWALFDHFDISAKAPANTGIGPVRAMFRALLAQRFGLTAQMEPRPMDVDVLTMEKPAALGPNLVPSTKRCEPPANCDTRTLFGHLEGTDVSSTDIASALSLMTRRLVIDHTGLTGRYNVSLKFTPDAITLRPALRSDYPQIDPDGPSLSTALKEQLGIKMKTQSEKVDVLVIDHVEKPTPD